MSENKWTGKTIISKKDGQKYKVGKYDEKRDEYKVTSRYFSFYVKSANIENF